MSNKKKAKMPINKSLTKVPEEQQPKKNNALILGGVLLAISSIGLLIFVLSEKIFHLS